MVDALIAFVLAVLILLVFNGPAWAIKLGAFGGLGFALYVLILVIKYLIAQLK